MLTTIQVNFTSPRLRGEVDRAKRGRVSGRRGRLSISIIPLTRLPPIKSGVATLSPQAGRGKERFGQ